MDHLEDCDGNGVVDCWKCGGDGMYEAPDDDLTDDFVDCEECFGKGFFKCPACSQDGV